MIEKIPGLVIDKLNEIKEEIDAKRNKIVEGASQALINLMANSNSNNAVRDALMENSPYLSDEVLLAYIASNPPSGHLKQIMIANSQLSDQVKLALQASNIPVGTMNQIANVRRILWTDYSVF